MPLPDALTARLARLAGNAEQITDAIELADARAELDRLREPERLSTAAGLALAEITAERRAVERAARAARLRDTPDLKTLELDLAANPERTPR